MNQLLRSAARNELTVQSEASIDMHELNLTELDQVSGGIGTVTVAGPTP